MLVDRDIQRIFEDLGCKRHSVNGIDTFEKDGVFYRLPYVKGLNAYVIETADSLDEAKKNRFEDDDTIEIIDDKGEMIYTIKKMLSEYYL